MKKVLVLAVVGAFVAPAHAGIFDAEFTSGAFSESFSFDTAGSAIDSLDLELLSQRITQSGGTFDENTSPASVDMNYRGLDMRFAFAQNSNTLVFSVPSLGINETFIGNSREDSVELLQEYLKGDGGSALNRINKALVAESPFDPLAGNPGSMMANMVGNAFDYANAAATEVGRDSTENTLDFSLRFGRYSLADKKVDSYSLPFSYTVRFDSLPGHRLQLRVPLAYSEVDGQAKSYSAGLGLAYTLPLLIDGLETTPAIDYGVMGSEDFYSAAAMRSISLTTRYEFSLFGERFALTNSLMDVSTESVTIDDIEVDAGLSNRVMTNGIMWMGQFIGGFDTQLFLRDTRYYGDELYSERANEIGVSIGHPRASLFGNPLFVGASYLFADRSEVDGFKVNFGASF